MPYPLYMKRVKAQKKKERRERRDVRRPSRSWLPFRSDALPSCLSAVSLGRDASPEKEGKAPEKVKHLNEYSVEWSHKIISLFSMVSGRGKGRWKETTRSIKPHVGTSTRDGLVLSQRDISRVKKSSAPRKHS